jgi:hypothetical protein
MLLEPFDDPAGLRAVIGTGILRVRWSPPWVHASSRYAKIYKKVTGSLRGLDMAS